MCPDGKAQSAALTGDETYSVTSFILFINGIVNAKAELNERQGSKRNKVDDGSPLFPVPTTENTIHRTLA